jgi:hypothetical protein
MFCLLTRLDSSQKNVAVGIKQARDAVNQMTAAITTANAALSSSIATAQSQVVSLQAGGQGVLSASVSFLNDFLVAGATTADTTCQGVTFADLGLPANFAN